MPPAVGTISWSGSASPGSETLLGDDGAKCFGADGRPAASSGCDVFALDVAVPAGFYDGHPGAVNITSAASGSPISTSTSTSATPTALAVTS